MVEIVVMLGILAFVSAILLTTFPGFNEGALAVKSEQEIALAIRRVQNIAVSVAEVEVTLSGGSKIRLVPQSIGVYFNLAVPDQFLMFADLDGDNRYGVSDGVMGDPVKLLRGIKFVQFSDTNGIQTVINITFTAPQADIVISNQETSSGKTFASLTLRTPNQQISKTVSVWKSGQISLD